MASVLNKITKQYIRSVHTPDFSPSDWIVNPDLSAVEGVPVEYWKITGDVVSEMNQSEKDAVDAVLIVGEKQAKINEFTYTASRIVEDRYFASQMSVLSAMLAEAYKDAQDDRAAYIKRFVDWGNSIANELNSKIAEINSKTTRGDVADVVWDTTTVIAADPKITIVDAEAIPNVVKP